MNGIKIVALFLILAGGIGLAYGRVSFTKKVHRATVGPISLTARETQDVVIPVWAAAGVIVVGGLMLMSSRPALRS
jgi:hypothetical protein